MRATEEKVVSSNCALLWLKQSVFKINKLLWLSMLILLVKGRFITPQGLGNYLGPQAKD